MNPLASLRGIVTVLNTPFTERDSIDIDGLQENVRRAAAPGVAGFLVPALASEVGKLSERERDAVVRATVEAAGPLPVIGGASAPEGETRLRLARRCLELGCAGVLAAIPYQSETQYRRDVAELASVRPPFLMLQDWDASGFGVPVPLIARLFQEIEPFKALKIEVVPAGAKYTAVREATAGRLHLSGGWAVSQMIEGLDRGVDAFMPTGLHSVYTRIHALHTSGRRDDARALFNRLVPILAFSNQHLDISIHFFKRLLHRQGVYATDAVRKPILPFDAFHQRVADELIDDALALMNEIETSP